MFSFRLVRPGLFTRLRSFRYVLLGHGATVIHINPVRFDISNQEHFFEGAASVVMERMFLEAFGDLPAS